jgi:HD-GYP domain-containing protein (c-di-GMP phosphodiesterase class II)
MKKFKFKKYRHRYNKLSTRLIATIALTVIICFGIFTYNVSTSIAKSEIQRFEQITNLLSQQLINEADLLIDRIDDAGVYFETALTLSGTIDEERESIYEGLNYYDHFTKSVFLVKSPSTNTIAEYYTIGDEKELTVLKPDFDLISILDQYKAMSAYDTQFIYYDPTTKKLFTIKKLYQASSDREILLGIEIDTRIINQAIKNDTSDLLGNVGITTSDGYIFAHTDKKFLGQSMTDLSTGTEFGNNLSRAIKNSERLRTSINNKMCDIEILEVDNLTFIYIPIPIESYNTSWGITVDIKDHVLKESSMNIAKTIVLGGFLTLAGIILTVKLIVRQGLKPIDSIMSVMKDVEKGDLESRTAISSCNEMEVIGSQLNNLLDHMIEDRDSIVKQKNEIEELLIEVENLMQENDRIYFETIKSLAKTIDAKDQYTGGHCDRVTEFSLYIGKEMGLSQEQLSSLTYGAMLHDIGKIGVPESIITKEGRLTDEEYTLMKSHPEKGYEILKDIHFLKDARLGVLQHHERYDGKGYPQGLAGQAIDLKARIISIADAFDAMTSDRSYRKALSIEMASQQLIDNKGIQFDPHMVDILINGINNNRIKL